MTEPFDQVLVACPTYLGKSYALDEYIQAYNHFTFPHRGLYMVDNTGTGLRYYEHLKSLNVACDHIPPTNDWQETFAMCWKRITQYAKENGYKWVASIEQDNICPPMTLDILLNVAGYCKAVHVAHSYPWHQFQTDKGGVLIGLGCNLLSVELLEKIFEQEKWITDSFEAESYAYPEFNHLVMVEIDHMIDVRHLDGLSNEFYSFEREKIPIFTKGKVGTRTPIIPNNGPTYCIVAPEYTHVSAGIRALHVLKDQIIKRGRNAVMVYDPINTVIGDDDIAVYPEVVKGNPLNAKKVIRYVLNYPGLIGGDKEYDPSEKIITWFDEFYPGAPILQVPIYEDFFKDEGGERTIDCVWVGRGTDVGMHPEGCTRITYDFPQSRTELASLLNKTKTLYSYDNGSLPYEALLCGCEVKVAKGKRFVNFRPQSKKWTHDFDNQIEVFMGIYS